MQNLPPRPRDPSLSRYPPQEGEPSRSTPRRKNWDREDDRDRDYRHPRRSPPYNPRGSYSGGGRRDDRDRQERGWTRDRASGDRRGGWNPYDDRRAPDRDWRGRDERFFGERRDVRPYDPYRDGEPRRYQRSRSPPPNPDFRRRDPSPRERNRGNRDVFDSRRSPSPWSRRDKGRSMSRESRHSRSRSRPPRRPTDASPMSAAKSSSRRKTPDAHNDRRSPSIRRDENERPRLSKRSLSPPTGPPSTRRSISRDRASDASSSKRLRLEHVENKGNKVRSPLRPSGGAQATAGLPPKSQALSARRTSRSPDLQNDARSQGISTGPPPSAPTGPRAHNRLTTQNLTPLTQNRHLPEAGEVNPQVPPQTPVIPSSAVSTPTLTRPNQALWPRLPKISQWPPTEESAVTPLEKPISHSQQVKASLRAECIQCLAAVRQSCLELELAQHELKAAEQRREVADQLLELAMLGKLGIDADKSRFPDSDATPPPE